jgi:3-methylcrotonyl-CoA carboxylase alpha subunit
VGSPKLDVVRGDLSALIGSTAVCVGAVIDGDDIIVSDRGQVWRVSIVPFGENPDDAASDAGGLAAPMPGKVVAMMVEVGTVVARGQALAVLEAMKMEHVMTAPQAGRVSAIFHPAGSQVQEGSALLAVEPIAASGAAS